MGDYMKNASVGLLLLVIGAFSLLRMNGIQEIPGQDMTAIPSVLEDATNTPDNSPEYVMASVIFPRHNQVVKSPLYFKGSARGTWYFEGSFPVKIIDANGKQLGIIPAQAKGEWMTEDLVQFEGEIAFEKPTTGTGFIVFLKDNPSGLPEHDGEFRVPIIFDPAPDMKRTVELYYYNPNKDKGENGDILCSDAGIEVVKRIIPVSVTPVQDTIRLLLKGELTSEEKERGLVAGFPLAGFELLGVSQKDGGLELKFADPQHKTRVDLCRASTWWTQIETTALQFPGIESVWFIPEDLFQP